MHKSTILLVMVLAAVPAAAFKPYEQCSSSEAPAVIQAAIHEDHGASHCDNYNDFDT